MRRILLHVLPKGLQRVRTFGFLANRCVTAKLALCRQLLEVSPPESIQSPAAESPPEAPPQPPRCPHCERGVLELVEEFCRRVPILDSS